MSNNKPTIEKSDNLRKTLGRIKNTEEMVAEIDSWIAEGKFKSLSDTTKTIISIY